MPVNVFLRFARETRTLLGRRDRKLILPRFLVGKIKDVIPSPDHPKRFLIQFSEYARLNVSGVWKKADRNPLKYARTLADLKIDPATLKWQSMPIASQTAVPASGATPHTAGSLTMAEAKKGLALTFGVKPEAIEITIRG